MVEKTTISLDWDVKERLGENYRHDKHRTWTEWCEAVMRILPPLDEFECVNCGEEPWNTEVPTEEYGGVIRWFKAEYDDQEFWNSNWYCSAECLEEMEDDIQRQVPEMPDRVLVGGADEIRCGIEGARFMIDGEQQSVTVGTPGALSGTSVGGREYDYVGEPVYIKNRGEVVQHGVVDDIIHEEAHTVIILGHDHATELLNHPDEQKREEYEEMHAEWYNSDCPECGAELRVCEDWEGDDEIDISCHECSSELFVAGSGDVVLA
jgi:hypothetical protein